ncbi:MAG: potassium transporter TrkH [Oscillospiraceae bacterium]|nr:potassium transporter TrkH [Oscillospiraceae bacterium]
MNRDKARITSAQLIPLSFIIAILVGALLLMLPFATADGESTDILTALFTSTTSVCVTGLVVVDTFSHWTIFGKTVILILIQLGGLGIITVTSALMLFVHKKMSLKSRLLIHDAFNLNTIHGLLRFLRRVVKSTFAVEGMGALLYMTVFIPKFGVAEGIWQSVFTAVSAFCNAGLDVLGPDSLISYNSNPLILIVTMALIVIGGLGYIVWFNTARTVRVGIKKRYSPATTLRRLSEHTKLVLCLTAFFILFGAVLIFIFEYDNPDTIGRMSLGGKILNSFFQSVTLRTAGFSSVSQGALRGSSALLGCLFMFIGGSPMGTAGGVKTVAFFVIAVNVLSFIENRDETVIFDRRVPAALIRKATAIITVSAVILIILLIALVALEDIPALDALYEMASAIGTVGLSRGITPSLGGAGRILIIIGMYLGRIGPISMALFFNTGAPAENSISVTEGKFIVG